MAGTPDKRRWPRNRTHSLTAPPPSTTSDFPPRDFRYTRLPDAPDTTTQAAGSSAPPHSTTAPETTSRPKRSLWRTLRNSLHLGQKSGHGQTRSASSSPAGAGAASRTYITSTPAGSTYLAGNTADTDTRSTSRTPRPQRRASMLSTVISPSRPPRKRHTFTGHVSSTNRRPAAEVISWWNTQERPAAQRDASAQLQVASHVLAQRLASQIVDARSDDRASRVDEFTKLVTLLYRSVHTTCLTFHQKNELLTHVQLLNLTWNPQDPGTSQLKEHLDRLESEITDIKGVPPDAQTVEWDKDTAVSTSAGPSSTTPLWAEPGPSAGTSR